eukprot:maker-scaffold131_size323982-snap-gene-2.23 protein:Tk05555 transcript:maker-scaffold131_size323982-snap-gene-2.23-mRNA-1 annotation:"probable g-protein coupled receptor cg31760-like"
MGRLSRLIPRYRSRSSWGGGGPDKGRVAVLGLPRGGRPLVSMLHRPLELGRRRRRGRARALVGDEADQVLGANSALEVVRRGLGGLLITLEGVRAQQSQSKFLKNSVFKYGLCFRWILLLISISCVFLSLVMIGLVYKFRRDKVFKLASPTFLSITLVGCAIMYLEMVAIFPYLNMPFCIATKWTRNMGFLVTYSALLMKTWRVSLTFRVKSAHKLKLTDNQLLQWFFPILLIMVIYLCSWTFSDPPQGLLMLTLAPGEIVFLFWGIRVCFSVRKARTHFGEARLIRWSIYNIASVNLVMVSIHVFLFPHAGPDMKYFLGFLRTQMSTTTTIILVLGTKFWRIYNGTANDLDDQLRAKGNTACMFSIPFDDNEEPKDLACENEELKEEIQKLASQIQYLRIVGMLTANFHCKNKNNFSLENSSKVFQENLEACLQNGSLSTASFHRTLSLNQPKGARGNRLKSHQPLTGTSSCSVQIHKYRSNNRRSLGTFSPSGLPMSEANHSMRIKADVGSRSVCIADPASSARPVLSYLPASRGAPEHHRHGLEANVEEYVVTSPSGRVISSPLDTLGDREGKARPTLPFDPGIDFGDVGNVLGSRTSARGHPRSDARFNSFKVADAQIRLSDGIPVISDRSTHEILSEILLLATKRIRSLRTP